MPYAYRNEGSLERNLPHTEIATRGINPEVSMGVDTHHYWPIRRPYCNAALAEVADIWAIHKAEGGLKQD